MQQMKGFLIEQFNVNGTLELADRDNLLLVRSVLHLTELFTLWGFFPPSDEFYKQLL